MDRMLVVVTDSEKKACRASAELQHLHVKGSISLHAKIVARKEAGSLVQLKLDDYQGPAGTAMGLTLGSLIGAIGGPVGIATGAAIGSCTGLFADAYTYRLAKRFVANVGERISDGEFVVIAKLHEADISPVNSCIHELGCELHRRTLLEVDDHQWTEWSGTKESKAYQEWDRLTALFERN